jgi:hypothetical protein
MERTLRKSPISVPLTYPSSFTNNLRAGPVSLDERDGIGFLILDFSSNLRARNKQVNSYADARELAEKYRDLKSIQIDEQFVRMFVEKTKDLPERRLQIVLGNERFTYSIQDGTSNNGSVFLNLKFESKE